MKNKYSAMMQKFSMTSTSIMLAILCQNAMAGVPVVDGPAGLQRTLLEQQNEMHRAAQVQSQISQQQSVWSTQASNMQQTMNTLNQQLQQIKPGSAGQQITAMKYQSGQLDSSTYGQSAASTYLPGTDNQCGPANNSRVYQACDGERRIRAASYDEMSKLMLQMNQRVSSLESLIQSGSAVTTLGQLQALQTKINGYQALIAADAARINLSLAMHAQKIELYRQQQSDATQAALRGNGQAVSLQNVVNNLTSF